MPGLRTNSRKMHPEAWEQLTRFRRLRRLTGRALKAKGRGDVKTMARMAQLLRRFHGEDIFRDDGLQPAAPKPTLFQKGVSGIKKFFSKGPRAGGDR